MEKQNKLKMISLLNEEIKNLHAEYAKLISETGKYEKLKEIRNQLRKAEGTLNTLGM